MTVLTALGSTKLRNAKPRDRPVMLSRMMVQLPTSPNCEKYRRSESTSKMDSKLRERQRVSRALLRPARRSDRGKRAIVTFGSVPVQTAHEHFSVFNVKANRNRYGRMVQRGCITLKWASQPQIGVQCTRGNVMAFHHQGCICCGAVESKDVDGKRMQ